MIMCLKNKKLPAYLGQPLQFSKWILQCFPDALWHLHLTGHGHGHTCTPWHQTPGQVCARCKCWHYSCYYWEA